ncbi:serine hydrolase [Chachezhania antarctica]|uniref:serine hydrolase n=1 Tax=Chachezhania antarctica TaxID=2340860 RepID=UPI0013CEBA0D|nr:serine hydrolase [Chachezhania antarctica]|tara:strand:+ start:1991 stop:3100 length:1110 start_codon:yes stop_codon:yes gene_type:complete
MKHAFAAISMAFLAATPAVAEDRLLSDTLEFTGQLFFIDAGVPGVVMAAVHGDESVVMGFGETTTGSGIEPDGDTQIGVGSVTKAFTGLSLASLVADGEARLTDTPGPHDGVFGALPSRDGHDVRLVDLATHSSGLPRELVEIEGAEKYTDASFAENLSGDPYLFTPGEGILYSNVGFDVLAMALSDIAGKPYPEVLQERVLDPIGLDATGYELADGDNVFGGHDWNGNPMDFEEFIDNRAGAASLRTTANDMVRFLRWNLDQFGTDGAEMRALSHAAWTMRDGKEPVIGMDESGHMSAMGLGWVIMMPEGDRPLIIQKAGGQDGIFSYLAFSPSRDVGIFIAINEFNFGAGLEMATTANEFIAAMAPR